MQFYFLDNDEKIIGTATEAITCKVDEVKYTASFSFAETDAFSFDDVKHVGFYDIDNNLVFYEAINISRKSGGSVVSISAEHDAFRELLSEVVESATATGSTAGYAANEVLADTRWQVRNAETTPVLSKYFYYKNAWECLNEIQEATHCAYHFGWTISGNAITGRYLDITARQGEARGKRFDLSKDLVNIEVKEDRSAVYTAIYGRGKGEEIGTGSAGQTTYGRKLDFSEVVWSIANGDPLNKPYGQKYLEDPAATQSFGFGPTGAKRPRSVIINYDDCEDEEELLQLTFEDLKKTRYPKLVISGKVVDLERVWGYQHEAVRVGDDVLVIADEWNATYQDSIVGLVRDYINHLNTSIVIGESGSTIVSISAKNAVDLKDVKDRANYGYALASANPDLLRGVINTMATQIISTGTGISTDTSDGSLILTANDQSSAVKLTGNGILIADSKVAGQWVWGTAVNGNGVATGTLTAGTINASIIKILGTDQFYWDASNIYIKNPDSTNQQIRIGLYDGEHYGIGYTTDGGNTWQNAIGFDGVHFAVTTLVDTLINSPEYQQSISELIGGIQFGGVNLIEGSASYRLVAGDDDGTYWVAADELLPEKEYTLSIGEVVLEDGTADSVSWQLVNHDAGEVSESGTLDFTYGRQIVHFTVPEDTGNWALHLYAGESGRTSGNTVLFTKAQLEEGISATSWSAAPSDMAAKVENLSSNVDRMDDGFDARVQTIIDGLGLSDQFASTEEFLDALSRIEQIRSDVAQTNSDLSVTFTRLAQTEGNIIKIMSSIVFGDDQGTPYLEMGTTESVMKMRLTNTRLAFVQSGQEIAYFSDNKIHTTRIEIGDTLSIGNDANGYMDIVSLPAGIAAIWREKE